MPTHGEKAVALGSNLIIHAARLTFLHEDLFQKFRFQKLDYFGRNLSALDPNTEGTWMFYHSMTANGQLDPRDRIPWDYGHWMTTYLRPLIREWSPPKAWPAPKLEQQQQ